MTDMVYILMGDTGDEYEPDISIWGVYKDKSYAEAERYEQENQIPEGRFWVEDWRVE